MLVIRGINANNSLFFELPFNFVNPTYKFYVFHWTSMTTGQTTYTTDSINWTTTPPLLKINYVGNVINDSCFFKVTFV
jgi:hypothetical protein